jgi:methionyl-tRNA formyltransferase
MPSAVVLGSKPGSYAALQLLIDKHWEIKAVVFSDTIQHKFIEGPDISDLAKKNKIPVYSSQKELPDLTCDFVISYMYRFLVKERVLNFAQRAAVNFHPGPLPEFGGWAFYNMAILEQSDEYGCTCHYMDNSFDTGDILKIRRFPIKHQLETAVSLERRTQKEMILLFMEF